MEEGVRIPSMMSLKLSFFFLFFFFFFFAVQLFGEGSHEVASGFDWASSQDADETVVGGGDKHAAKMPFSDVDGLGVYMCLDLVVLLITSKI